MKITVLLFGIATDLIGSSSLEVDLPINCTIPSFKELLTKQHPKLEEMTSYGVALNESYTNEKTIIKEEDIIAIIPPVSGG